MNTYVISYDLNSPGQNYADLYEAIKNLGTWWHCLDSTWLVKTSKSAVEARNALTPCLDGNDKILVATLSGEAAWTGFSDNCAKWLKDKL